MLTDVSGLRSHRCTIIASIPLQPLFGGRGRGWCASRLDKGHKRRPLRGSPNFVRLGPGLRSGQALDRLRSLPQLAARDRRAIAREQAPARSAHSSAPLWTLGLARSHPPGAAVARSPMAGERRRRRGDGGHPLGEPEHPHAAASSPPGRNVPSPDISHNIGASRRRISETCCAATV
jgi:hypothetical protein